MNSLEQAEDLKAFERRLTEYVSCLQPATGRWRMILIVVSVCTATGAWNWLIDPDTQKVSFFSSLWNHPFFTISCITLIALFFAGIHKRVVAPSMYPFSLAVHVKQHVGRLSCFIVLLPRHLV
uniref:Nuclear envelope phosphatase-regulatory subunit 1 n=1 Tax=Sparus aurata TaxID=8175 RepID=A0A671XEH0_SPAAU